MSDHPPASWITREGAPSSVPKHAIVRLRSWGDKPSVRLAVFARCLKIEPKPLGVIGLPGVFPPILQNRLFVSAIVDLILIHDSR